MRYHPIEVVRELRAVGHNWIAEHPAPVVPPADAVLRAQLVRKTKLKLTVLDAPPRLKAKLASEDLVWLKSAHVPHVASLRKTATPREATQLLVGYRMTLQIKDGRDEALAPCQLAARRVNELWEPDHCSFRYRHTATEPRRSPDRLDPWGEWELRAPEPPAKPLPSLCRARVPPPHAPQQCGAHSSTGHSSSCARGPHDWISGLHSCSTLPGQF